MMVVLPELSRWLLLIFASMLLIFLQLMGFYLYKKMKTYDDFNVAGRGISFFPILMTVLGTAFGGSTILGYMSDGYIGGLKNIWMGWNASFGGIFFTLVFVKAIRNVGSKYKMVTVADFLAKRYGEKVRIPSIIGILFGNCAITGIQFIALASFFNLIFGLDLKVGIFLGFLFLTLYTFLGGLTAVIYADTINGLLQIAGMIVLPIMLLIKSGGWGTVVSNVEAAGMPVMLDFFAIEPSHLIMLVLSMGLFQLVRPDRWQRVWAAKNIKISYYGFIAAEIICLFIVSLPYISGVIARFGMGVQVENPTMIFYAAVANAFSPTLISLMILSLLATIISCGDSFIVAASAFVVNDIFRAQKKGYSEEKKLQLSRTAVFCIVIPALLFAYAIPNLVILWLTGMSMTTSSILIAVVAGFFWKRSTSAGALAAIIGGIISSVAWQILGKPYGIETVFIGMGVSLILMVAVSLATKRTSEEMPEELYYFNNNKITSYPEESESV